MFTIHRHTHPSHSSHPTQKLITQHTLSFLYFLALMVQRRNTLRRLPRRSSRSRIRGSTSLGSTSLGYEIRHIEPKHTNLGGLSHSVAPCDCLVFNTRIPVRTYEIYIRIRLKVQAFTTGPNL